MAPPLPQHRPARSRVRLLLNGQNSPLRPPSLLQQPPQNSQGRGQKTMKEALAYLKVVREAFHDEKEKYQEFLELMKAFNNQRIETVEVIGRVKELFEGHRDLIAGFNTFLPEGFEISLQSEDRSPYNVRYDEAINFVRKIHDRFQHDRPVYAAFLEILNDFKKGSKSVAQVHQDIGYLFREHDDLLEEFKRFLPYATTAPSAQHVSSETHGPAASLSYQGNGSERV